MPRGSVDVSINMPQSCYNFNQVIVLAANQLFDAKCKSEGTEVYYLLSKQLSNKNAPRKSLFECNPGIVQHVLRPFVYGGIGKKRSRWF